MRQDSDRTQRRRQYRDTSPKPAQRLRHLRTERYVPRHRINLASAPFIPPPTDRGISKGERIEYITDSSNLSCDYRRNYLRNRIIPLLREEWKGFDKSLDRSIALIRSENAVVNEATESLLLPRRTALCRDVMSFPAPQLLVRRYIEPLLPFTTTAAEVVSAIIADKPDKRCWKLRVAHLHCVTANFIPTFLSKYCFKFVTFGFFYLKFAKQLTVPDISGHHNGRCQLT